MDLLRISESNRQLVSQHQPRHKMLRMNCLLSTSNFCFYFTHETRLPIDAGITGLGFQCALLFFMEVVRRSLSLSPISPSVVSDLPSTGAVIFPNRPAWDIPSLQRFGSHTLTPQLLWKAMDGVYEPMANPWWVAILFFSISMITPMTAENEPPINAETGTFSTDQPPATYNGIPWWVFKIMMNSIIPLGILLISIWRLPDNFPVNKKRIKVEGISPDLVELTLHEKGQRTCYDKANFSVHRRRCAIMAKMNDLGMTNKLKAVDEDPSRAEDRQTLIDLVISGDSVIDEDEEELACAADEWKLSNEH